MAFATFSEQAVIRADIHEPRTGAWHADLEVDTSTELSGRQVLDVAGGVVSWSGTVLRGGIEAGRWHGRIIGGAGGLATELPAAFYLQAPVGVVLADILSLCDEVLSGAVLGAILASFLPRWQRSQGRASDALAALLGALAGDLVWRLDRAGELMIVEDSYPALAVAHTSISRRPQLGDFLVAPTDAPELRPGVTFEGDHVDYVHTTIAAGGLRQRYWVTA